MPAIERKSSSHLWNAVASLVWLPKPVRERIPSGPHGAAAHGDSDGLDQTNLQSGTLRTERAVEVAGQFAVEMEGEEQEYEMIGNQSATAE
jgi:hypothetical protein